MRLLAITLIFICSFTAVAQDASQFSTNFRFRLQNRFTYQTKEAQKLTAKHAQFEIRRAIAQLEGHIIDPRLLYKFQIIFNSTDSDKTERPNILKDAVIGWKLRPYTTLYIGQTKLPGNRENLVSSGSQQFVDRSIVNSKFSVDRDTGIQLSHRIGDEMPVWLRLSVSNGEGISSNNKDSGMAYTSRLEWLPLGSFTNGGDYFEGDLERETDPKLSIATSYSSNKKTIRSSGQSGKLFKTPELNRDMDIFFADFLFKYQGFSWSTEYAKRWTQNPVFQDTDDAKTIVIYKGQGFNTQAAYIFDNNIEMGLRYSRIWGDKEIRNYSDETNQYTIVTSKYIKGHNLKIQTDLSYSEDIRGLKPKYMSSWTYRLQLQVGI